MTLSENDPVMRRLSAGDEAACLGMMVHLCRMFPPLRAWLCDEFARDAKVRERFARVVDERSETSPERFIDLTDDVQAWREERRQLKATLSTRPFGGLTLSEVETLIRRFQAGTIDLGTFQLVREWHTTGRASPAVMWAGLQFLDSLLPARAWRLHKHLRKAFSFHLHFGKQAKRRAAFAPAGWWKTQVLLYMLGHPRPSYRTGELREHLASLGVEVSTKDLRRFCSLHGIRRDVRGGRPRTRSVARAA